MPRFTTLALLIATTFLAPAACEGDGDDQGSGSGTLQVECNIIAENPTSNSDEASQFAVHYRVVLTKDGQPVSDAFVSVFPDGGGEVVLAEVDGTPGRYEADGVGYRGRYRLEIHKGSDYVEGVVLTGPDIHVFTSPVTGAQVPGDQDLEVRWSRQEQAPVASILTKRLGDTPIQDTGEYTLSSSYLEVGQGPGDPPSDNFIQIDRSTTLVPAGGAANSMVTVTVKNRVDFTVQ